VGEWVIIRTDFRKEGYVAQQIRNLTFDAWHPVQVIACRPSIARRVSSKAQLRAYREISILPRRIFASVPVWALLQGELSHIRHLVAIEHGADSRPLSVPHEQIAAFRAEIDAANAAEIALRSRAGRKSKAKWKKLHDGFREMLEQAKSSMELAA